ncbi:MAG: hypothetical protein C0434_12860 [Xanthomonadaceae bacterium]|nr:hypothetical protein [Xanthomonadaceae bacterium]
MAISRIKPLVYDAVYQAGPLSLIEFFVQGNATTIQYVDAASATISRRKGFEDTNLTEDGRVTETAIQVWGIGLNIIPGDASGVLNHAADIEAFWERGYLELITGDTRTEFTGRIKDFPPRTLREVSGTIETDASATISGRVTVANRGLLFPIDGIVIPQGQRFCVRARWDRPLALPSAKTARFECELWGGLPGAPKPPAAKAPVRK